jgi:hypothetical protein
MEDEGIADDDGFGDRWSCAAAADSARTRSCRMASASSSSLPMASRKEEQSWTEAELCERREGECLPLSASIGERREGRNCERRIGRARENNSHFS